MRTRPDIAYAVSIEARFCSQPTKEHLIAVKHILQYLNGTQNYSLLDSSEETSSLIGYSDTDWAGNIDDCKSTTDYLFKLGRLLSIGKVKSNPVWHYLQQKLSIWH